MQKLKVVSRIKDYFNLLFGIHKACHYALLHCMYHHSLGLFCSVLFYLLLSTAEVLMEKDCNKDCIFVYNFFIRKKCRTSQLSGKASNSSGTMLLTSFLCILYAYCY